MVFPEALQIWYASQKLPRIGKVYCLWIIYRYSWWQGVGKMFRFSDSAVSQVDRPLGLKYSASAELHCFWIWYVLRQKSALHFSAAFKEHIDRQNVTILINGARRKSCRFCLREIFPNGCVTQSVKNIISDSGTKAWYVRQLWSRLMALATNSTSGHLPASRAV